MVDELIKSVLMEYISPSDYDLHDWDTIIERRTQYSDDVYIYHCVYGDIYLTEDLEFYDAEPKQPIHNDLRFFNLSEEDKLVVSVLKEYISSDDYDLHDWGSILERKEKVNDEVYLYPCVYGNIMLTSELEFYDAEPKQPIHNSLRNKLSVEDELIMTALCDYIPVEYRKDIDWQTIISRREQIKPNIYKYSINNIDFYMDDDLNPIEYGKIHIINNNIYYDFNLTDVKITPYVLFGEL